VSWIWAGWLFVGFGALLSLSGTLRRSPAARAAPAPAVDGVPAE